MRVSFAFDIRAAAAAARVRIPAQLNTTNSGKGATRLRRRDLVLGAILAAMATVAAVAVPLGYGGVVNGASCVY